MRLTAFTAWLCWLLVLGAGSSGEGAEQKDRRGRTEPGLILDTRGRNSACDVLTFTPDGKHLLATGDDKVVRIWDFDGSRLDDENSRKLRWTIWRQQRGAIFRLDVWPRKGTPQKVVFAGLGAITNTVVIADFKTGKILHALTREASRHLSGESIWGVAFSPSGQKVAFGHNDGHIYIWDLTRKLVPDTNPRWIGQHQAKVKGTDGKVKVVSKRVSHLRFLNETILLSLGEDLRFIQWDLENLKGANTGVLFQFSAVQRARNAPMTGTFAGDWFAMSGTRGGKTNLRGVVQLYHRPTGQSRIIQLKEGYQPKHLGFSVDGKQLAVGAYFKAPGRQIDEITGGKVFLYDLNNTRDPRMDIATAFYPEGVAFHPDGKHLAIADSNNHEVKLYALEAGGGKLLQTIEGPGMGLWSVGLASRGDRLLLGFQSERQPNPVSLSKRGRGDWQVFDVHQQRWVKEKDFRPEPVLETLMGWKVKPGKEDIYKWEVIAPDGTTQQLDWDKVRDGKPTCYTFLKSPENTKDRVMLAIGHYWGFSIYELKRIPKGPKPLSIRRIRLGYGHNGEVMALAPSPDHTLLVSAARDQTIRCWSVAPWARYFKRTTVDRELGTSFRVRLGKLLVDRVAPGSPGWEAGLSRDDEIVALACVERGFLYNNGGDVHPGLIVSARQYAEKQGMRFRETKEPAEVLKFLEKIVPGEELYFKYRRPTQGKKIYSTLSRVRQRPLWNFFPQQDREWVLWLWHSYQYASSAQGDTRIGWQVNGARMIDTPTFYRAEQFRKRFHRPGKILAGVPLKRASLVTIEPPDIQLKLRKKVGGYLAMVHVEPRGKRPEHQADEVILWLNDCKYKTWPGKKGKATFELNIPTRDLRHGKNWLIAQCYNSDRELARGAAGKGVDLRGRGQTEPVLVDNARGLPKPGKLYVVAVGLYDYEQARRYSPLRGSPPDLAFPQKDAESVVNLLQQQHKRGMYSELEAYTLYKHHGTRPNILQQLDALHEKVKPDDRLVLFLSGHGYAERIGPGVFAPDSFTFCTYDFDFRELLRTGDTGLTSEDMYTKLTRLNCRKLILLDSCHSGSLCTDTGNALRSLTREGIGPFILTASQGKEEAQESIYLGHGVFTQALLEAVTDRFTKTDANHDGVVTAQELSEEVKRSVPRLCKENELGDVTHHPYAHLPKLEREIIWFRAPSKEPGSLSK